MYKSALFKITLSFTLMLSMTACSYNPFRTNNELTGNAWGVGIGAAAGAGTAAAVGNTSHFWYGVAGITGASIGYYVTSLRFASAGIIQSGGQVYTLGDYVTIELPTDEIFDSNSYDLLPNAEPVLKSVVNVVNRYPNHNILISGNTSGFGSSRYEHKLSEDRARTIASYLWANGVTNLQFKEVVKTRKLNYVGYGNYFPIANNIKTEGVRANSRIQITIYPTKEQLCIDEKMKNFNNIGAVDDSGTTLTKPTYVDNSLPQGDVLYEQQGVTEGITP
jgi:outer membrane protein OmpA-like peptidoglycan-associated protein